MGFFDRLLGRTPPPMNQNSGGAATAGPQPVDEDRAVARYRYLLRTASPDQLEAVHAEAFARLSPEQRQDLLRELSASMPPGESASSDAPGDLARAATRAEMRQPGFLQQTFSRGSFAGGMGGTIMGSMIGTIAGFMVGSVIADAMLDGYSDSPEAQESGDPGPAGEAAGADSVEATGAGEAGGSDAGGSDVAGGDFGGGDFGGGDFGGF